MQNINYNQRFGTVLAVRDLGSYSAAAEALSLTPSAVSQQIHSLERELGVTLFTRAGKNLLPTRECDIIASYADRINELCVRMSSELSNGERNIQHLVAGVTPSVENAAISQVMTRYSNEHGDTHITVISENSAVLCDMLRKYAIDFAVVEGEFPTGEFNSVLLDTDYLVAAVANTNPLSRKNMVTIEDLKREKLILRLTESGTTSLFEAHLKKAGMELSDFRIMMQADSSATIKKLVENNYGVSVLSNKVCAKEAAAGRFRTMPIRDMNMMRSIHIIYRSDFKNMEMLRDIQRLYSEVN